MTLKTVHPLTSTVFTFPAQNQNTGLETLEPLERISETWGSPCHRRQLVGALALMAASPTTRR